MGAFGGAQLIPLVRRFPLPKLAAGLCFFAPLAAFFSYQVRGLPSLLVLGALMACASTAMGSLSNLFILHGTDAPFRARFYGILHAMYGFGSQLAPIALGLAVERNWDWQCLLVFASVPAVVLAFWSATQLPTPPPTPSSETQEQPFHWFSIQGLVVTSFCVYVAGEVLTSMWLVTFLVEVRGLSFAAATPYAAGFFVVVSLSRLACFWVRTDHVEAWVIRGCLLVASVCFFLGMAGFSAAFSFVGLIGPYFPLVLARVSRYLPREAPALTLRVMFMLQATLAVCHFATGYLCTTVGVRFAYFLPGVALVLAAVAIGFYFRAERRLVSI
jgi:MFS family permease